MLHIIVTITLAILLPLFVGLCLRGRRHAAMDADTIHDLFTKLWDTEACNEKAMRTVVMLYRELDSSKRECAALSTLSEDAIALLRDNNVLLEDLNGELTLASEDPLPLNRLTNN